MVCTQRHAGLARGIVGLPPRAPLPPSSHEAFLLLAPEGYPLLNTDQYGTKRSLKMVFSKGARNAHGVRYTMGWIQRASRVCVKCV